MADDEEGIGEMQIEKIFSKSILENGMAIMLTKMSLSVSSLIITILMARQLGPEPMGVFAIVMGLFTIVQYISILGYDTVVVREIAKAPEQGSWLIQQGVVLGLMASLIGIPVMLMAGTILSYSFPVKVSLLLSSISLLPSFLNVLAESIFIGLKKARIAVTAAFVRESTWLVLSVGALAMSQDINLLIGAFVISRFVGVAMFIFFLHQEGLRWPNVIHWDKLLGLRHVLPTFLCINVANNLLQELDVIILSKFVPVADVGYYSVAKKILRVSFIIIFGLIMALFPVIVETLHKAHDSVVRCFEEYTLRVLYLSCLIAVTVFFLVGPLIGLVLGQGFTPSIALVQALIWKIIPLSLSFLWSRFLIAANHQSRDMLALAMGLGVYLVTSILWVKQWGIIGMVYADLLCIGLLAFLHFMFTDRAVLRRMP